MTAIRVLVVDDEEDFADALVTQLNRRGFRASAVFSGEAAVASVQAREFDAVVLDLRMPGMDGLQALQEIRRADPLVEVLVLTGHGTVAAGIGGMRLGAADFLQKPVPIDTLCTAIEAAAERARAGRNQESEPSKGENT